MLFKKAAAAALAATLVFASVPAFAYEVKPGDTMYKIARGAGITLDEISQLNPEIENLNLIYPGQTVRTKADNTRSVKVSEERKSVNSSYSINASAYEVDLLARLVHAEAGAEPYRGKVAVAEVVLNRVKDPRFPSTVTAVIHQRNQFTPVASGSIRNTPTKSDYDAVFEAFEGSTAANGAIFFYNSATASNRWLDGRPTVQMIGKHTFKK